MVDKYGGLQGTLIYVCWHNQGAIGRALIMRKYIELFLEDSLLETARRSRRPYAVVVTTPDIDTL